MNTLTSKKKTKKKKKNIQKYPSSLSFHLSTKHICHLVLETQDERQKHKMELIMCFLYPSS